MEPANITGASIQTRRFPWADGSTPRSHAMKWETPTAIDTRFGFEITMYISNR
jgi:coenzyme PQQ precursor peptide PqqA